MKTPLRLVLSLTTLTILVVLMILVLFARSCAFDSTLK